MCWWVLVKVLVGIGESVVGYGESVDSVGGCGWGYW